MSKKFGKFLLFSAIAGAAVYGAYQYLQKKEHNTVLSGEEDDDDFDDFTEDLDEDLSASGKDRSYVSLNLDKAEAFAAEAFSKAKEVITDSVQQVKDTVLKSTNPLSTASSEKTEEFFNDESAVEQDSTSEQ